jgi:indole-3-glycerol phosphate synthase
MKDIIIHERQIEAAKNSGADCILLIQSILSIKNQMSTNLIKTAHDLGLEVLLEVHDDEELRLASSSEADIVGINNRNLANLEVNLDTTIKLLEKTKKVDKVIITESGLENAEDIQKLRESHIDGFLIGSSIMLADDIESKVREFVLA